MKLSIYLMNEDVKLFRQALQLKYLSGDDAFSEVESPVDLDFECVAYVQKNKSRAPKWVSFIDGHFDVNSLGLMNASNSFILLLRVRNRIFGVPFGYGYSVLDRSKIEPSFGLKVTLNVIDPQRIETLDTRNIDLVTKQRRTHVTVGSTVSELGLNQNIDWVRFVSGKPVSKDFATKLSGSDPLSITTDVNLGDLGSLCEDLLQKFQLDEYKKQFEFVDYLRPLKRSDPKVIELDMKLNQIIEERKTDKVTVALPEIPESNVDRYKIFCGYQNDYLEEVTLEAIYDFLEKVNNEEFFQKVFIVGMDSEDKPVTAKFKLYEFIVAEIRNEVETFVLSLGNWFKADNNYVAKIKDFVDSIPDVTTQLNIPPIRKGESEGEFNKRVGELNDWALFDKELMYFSATEKYEICDLLTLDNRFLCVKKMSSSATLSHLFAQGSVSARLLRGDSRVSEKIKSVCSQQWQGTGYPLQGIPQFVYVIPTLKEGAISDCLFFFSLINLVDHARSIKEVGYDVALCKVEYDS
ncbi:TIGR04141 family sporadically distributed protein [Paenibacillus sp. EKM208P]|nr:TIGR04141 family sporadically distributed protein [Paenibacillus sp. EKM208P]